MDNWYWKCLLKWMYLIQCASLSSLMVFDKPCLPIFKSLCSLLPRWTWAGLWLALLSNGMCGSEAICQFGTQIFSFCALGKLELLCRKSGYPPMCKRRDPETAWRERESPQSLHGPHWAQPVWLALQWFLEKWMSYPEHSNPAEISHDCRLSCSQPSRVWPARRIMGDNKLSVVVVWN